MPKGDATLTYSDPHAAKASINWFNGKEFQGSVITVEMATQKAPPPKFSRGRGPPRGDRGGYDRGGDRGGDRGDRGGDRGPPRGGPPPSGGRGMPDAAAGDWTCSGCSNLNWARRMVCNRCGLPNPNPSAAAQQPRGRGGDRRNDRRGPPRGGRGGDRGADRHGSSGRRDRPY